MIQPISTHPNHADIPSTNSAQITSPPRYRKRSFIPGDCDLTDWSTVERFYDELLSRPISSSADLERFLFDLDEIDTALTEIAARLNIVTSIDTSDMKAREKLETFHSSILAKQSERSIVLVRRYLEHPLRRTLDPATYSHMERLWQNSVDLYHADNIPLSLEDQNLGQVYFSITGGISATFRGKKLNLVNLATYFKDPDRSVREEAWRLAAESKVAKSEEIDVLFDRLIALRTQRAKNLGYDNFRDYHHRELRRFDYTPHDCVRFHQAMKEKAVPAFKRLQAKRLTDLGLTRLRPWDSDVDPKARPALRPFSTEEELVNKTAALLDRLTPNHGDRLRQMYAEGNLDLMTRQNKAMVGYNSVLEESGSSFIFMNSTGNHFDISVLAHETGHAVEKFRCRDQKLQAYRHAPSEWAELASQSHQLLVLDHLDVLYTDKRDSCRCVADEMEQLLQLLPRAAKIDAFQHWLYTQPEHTHQERHEKWFHLCEEYDGLEDWEGLESVRKLTWQAIAHLFIVPFYYIEYGISQLGALQVWQNVRSDGQPAMERFLSALELGFSKPIPELYHHAGIRFELFGPLVGQLIEFVEEQFERSCKGI